MADVIAFGQRNAVDKPRVYIRDSVIEQAGIKLYPSGQYSD